MPHQEINALPDAPLECVLVRSDNESVVVKEVYWIDPVHRQPWDPQTQAAGSLRNRPPGF